MLTLQDIERELSDFGYGLEVLSANLHSGFHKSIYKGSGFGFERHVPFEEDPDPRRIDWPASMQSFSFKVAQSVEEKTINVAEIDDFSASGFFGSPHAKIERVARIRAALAFAASKNHDRFQAIGVTDRVEEEVTFPPGSHRGYWSEIALKTLAFTKVRPGGGIPEALKLLPRPPALVFLVSDFLDSLNYYRKIVVDLKAHALIPVVLRDKHEFAVPETKSGFVTLQDLETGVSEFVWMGKKSQEAFVKKATADKNALQSFFRGAGLEALWLDGKQSDIEQLTAYFLRKEG